MNKIATVALLSLAGWLCAPGAAHAVLTTPQIVASAASFSCFSWRVSGICFWLRCSRSGCRVRTSTKVSHFLPDAVVSSYHNTGGNPWVEVAPLGLPNPTAQAGGHPLTPSKRRDNLPRFKNTDVVGHPFEIFNSVLSRTVGYVCPGVARPYVPYFLSTLDTPGWRWGIPETVYPEALIPTMREIGSMFRGEMWGNVYPRSGFVVQPDDAKSAAVMAQRAADIVTRIGQIHVYIPLTGRRRAGYWPPGPVMENNASTHKWQALYPVTSLSCSIFPTGLTQDAGGDYAWALWRPYSCCRRRGQIFLYSIDF